MIMRKTGKLQWAAGLLLIALLLLLLAAPAKAFESRAGDTVVVEEGEVIEDDLYASANTVEVKGTIKGDLLAAGNLIILAETGVVEGDLMAGGQGVVINGTVNDDVRIAGAVLAVGEKAKIGSDLVAFGYSLEISPGGAIGQDIVYYGGQALLSGEITRNATIGTGSLKLEGTIGGDVDADLGGVRESMPYNPLAFMPAVPGMPQVPSVAGGLTIGKETLIGGNLSYTAPQEASIPDGVISGNTTYKPTPPTTGEEAAKAKQPSTAKKVLTWFFSFLRELATLFLVGILFIYLWPRLLDDGSTIIQSKPWQSLLWGIVAYLAVIFAIILVIIVVVLIMVILGLITLGGLMGTAFGLGVVTISGLSVAFHVAVSYLSKILVSFLVGKLIFTRLAPEKAQNRLIPLIIGLLIVVLLASIPILGTIVNVVVVLLGLGALWLLGLGWWNKRTKVAEVLAPTPVN
jgi:cytoskeletal protein CcmA (bactofilin family)